MQSGRIHLPALNHPARKSGPNWIAIVSVALLVLLGFFGTLKLSGLLESHVELASRAILIIIVLFPALIGFGMWIIPKVWRKLRSIQLQLRWWHWLWFLAYLSSQVYSRGTETASAMPGGSTIIIRLGPETIILAILLLNLNRKGGAWVHELFRGLIGVMTFYALICAASAIWSVFPIWTLFKSLEYLLDISVVAAALANMIVIDDYYSVFNWVLTICGLETLWVWFQVPITPYDSFLEDMRLKGAFPLISFNAVGQAGALLAIIALCRLVYVPGSRKPDRGFYSILFAFGTATMLLAQTRSAVGGFVAAIVLILLFSRPLLAMTVGGMAGMLWAFSRVSGTVVTYLERGQNENSLHELTGREYFWSFAWELFKQHPVGGLGAYAAGRFLVQAKLHIFTATLHSDWVELLVGIGIIGIVPMALALLGAWRYLLVGAKSRLLTPQERQVALEALGILTVITIHSFFNDELIWHVPLYYLVVLGYAELVRRRLKAARYAGVPAFTAPVNWPSQPLAAPRQPTF